MATTGNGKRNQGNADATGRLGTVVKSSLIRAGVDPDEADKYTLLSMEIYRYLLEHPETLQAVKAVKDTHDVYDGTRKAFTAAGYIDRAATLGLSSAKSGFSAYGASGGAIVLQVFRERFEAFAKSQGFELNECSMAISALSLDIAAAGIGSVTALSGLGAVLAAFAVLGTLKDGYMVGQVCFVGKGS